jgi:hypothetical protein
MQDDRNFTAFRVFPVIPVTTQTGKYPVYPKGYWLRNEMAVRALGQAPRQAGYAIGFLDYRAEEYALEHVVDDRVRANSRVALSPDQGATMFLTQQAVLNWNILWAKKFFTSGVWTNELTGVASAPGAGQFLQFDQAGSNPVATVRRAKNLMRQATGFTPNVAVLGVDVMSALAENSVVLDRIKYTELGLATPELLASLLGVEELYEAAALQNVAAEGQNDNLQYVADSKSMLLAYRNPTTGNLELPSAGYTFAWDNLVPGQTNGYGGVVERGRDDRAHSDWFQIRQAVDMRAVAPDLAVFLKQAVS